MQLLNEIKVDSIATITGMTIIQVNNFVSYWEK